MEIGVLLAFFASLNHLHGVFGNRGPEVAGPNNFLGQGSAPDVVSAAAFMYLAKYVIRVAGVNAFE